MLAATLRTCPAFASTISGRILRRGTAAAPGRPRSVGAGAARFVLGGALLLLAAGPAPAVMTVSETFRNASAPGWSLIGNAVLTANGPDAPGTGWLRLTDNANNQSGSALYNTPFSSDDGVRVTFSYATYGGNPGADGFTFYLIDGATASPTVGASGGSLGYASGGSGPGVTNGYVGIGFDEYGNFTLSSVGHCAPSIPCPGQSGNQIAIRGSGNLNAGFNYLTRGSATIGTGSRAGARQVTITIVNNRITVVHAGTTVISQFDLASAPGQVATPRTFKMGFSGGTGGFTNYHEVRDLNVVNVKTSTSTALASSVNPSALGQQVTFQATVSPSAATGTVTFYDGATVLGTGTLSSGVATFSTSSLALGSHAVTALYGGDASYGISSSPVVTQVVKKTPGIYVLNNGPVPYRPLLAPTVIAPNLEVTFLTPTTISTAKVDISASYQSGSDVLGIQGQTGTSGTVDGLSWSFDAAAGVLTLSGSANEAVYQGALRQVTFYNANTAATTAQRTVTFSLGSGLRYPGTGHFYEFVTDPADLHPLYAEAKSRAAARSYFGLQGYLTTVTSQGESDFILNKLAGKGGWIGAESSNESGTVRWRWKTGPEGLESGGLGRPFWDGQVSGSPVGGAFTNWIAGITPNDGAGMFAYFIRVGCSWATCVPSKWDDIPDTQAQADSNIDGFVTEYGGIPGDPSLHLSDEAFITMGSPIANGILVTNAGPVSFPSLGAPIVVAPNLEISFATPTTIDTAKVDISASYQSGSDRLGILGQSGASGTVDGLSWSWDASIGVLTLTGTASEAVYQGALRKVTFVNTNPAPVTAQRTVTFSLGSGLRYPGTGHFYEFVPSAGITWTSAKAAAAARTYFGLQGYLVTVTSQGESDFCLDKLQGKQGWIGASDAATQTNWRWVTGPEGLEDGGQGRLFSTGSTPVGGNFTNWMPGQPDNSGDAAYFIGKVSWAGSVPSKWDDVPATYTTDMQGYVTEYGGMPGDPNIHLFDNAFVNILVPTLTLTKTAGADPVPAGTNATYTLAYANTGGAAAQSVVLTDAIPTGATFVSATGGGTLSGDTVTWNLGALAAAASSSVTVTVKAPVAAGTMTNSARIGAANAATVQATRSVTVQGPTIALTKTGPAGVGAGGAITYTLTYRNTGSGPAANVVLTDPIPAGATYVSATGPFATNGPPVTTVTWNIGTVAAGASGSVTLTVNAPAAAGNLANTATLSATSATPVTATATTFVTECRPSNGFLNLGTLSDYGPAAGRSYPALSAHNDTPVGITYSIPAGAGISDFGPYPYPAGSPWAPTDQGAVANTFTAGGKLTIRADFSQAVYGLKFNVSDIDSGGEVVEIRLYDGSGTLIPAGSIAVRPQASFVLDENSSSASYGTRVTTAAAPGGGVGFQAGTPGGPTDNDSAVFVQAGYAQAVARFEVDVTGNGTQGIWVTAPYFNLPCVTKTFQPGTVNVQTETSTVTLRLQNAIDTLAHPVALTDTLPAGLVLAAAPTASQCGGTVAGTAGGSTLTLSGTQLGPAQQACTVVATVQGTSGGSKVNDRSRVTSVTGLDRTGVNATLVVTQPTLALTKTATPTSVLVGGTVTYLLQYRNSGNGTAVGAQLTDAIPAGATYVSSSPAGSLAASTLTWSLGDLAAGASGSVSVVVRAPGAPATLTNTASLTASNATTAGANASVNVFGEPAFTFAVTDSPDPVRAGSNLSYTLTVTNTGTIAATGTTLSLPIPGNTTFVSATAGGTASAGAISWSLGSLAVGQTTSVVATVTVASPLANGTVLSTTGVANATNLASPVNGAVQTTVLSEPKLAVTLTAAPPLVQGGETVAFSIGFTNGGTDLAAGATLSFTAPASTSLVSLGGGSAAGQTVTWNLGNLAVGQSGSLAVTVRADSGVPNGTVLTGSAALASSTNCGTPAAPCGATADANVVVATAPLLRLTKTAPPYVAAGGSVTYELRYANDGNLDAQNVVLSDLLPMDTEFVSATSGGTCTYALAGPCLGFTDGTFKVTWPLGTVARGAESVVQLTVRTRSPLADGTPIVNTATLESTGAGGPQPASATATTRVTSRPVLTLTKTGKSPVAAGSQVVYTLTYENAGSVQATGVFITDQIPAGTTFVSATGGGTIAGGIVTWDLGTVDAGQGGSVNLTLGVGAAVPSGTVIVNTASVRSGELGDTSAQARTTVLSAPIPELSKSSTPASIVAAGASVTYVLAFRNSGNEEMTKAVLTDEVPLGLAPLFIGGGGAFDPVTRRITWNVGTVAPGASGSQTFGIVVPVGTPDGASLANTATFGADNALPVTAVHELLVSSAPVLELRKSAPPAAFAGGQATWTLEYRNTGNFTAYNVVLTDALPPEVTYFSAGGVHTVNQNTVTWSLGDLLPGAGGSVSLTAAVRSPLADGTLLANGATLEATNAAGVSTIATTRVLSAPLLTLAKVAPSQVAAGGQVLYQLTCRNLGTDVATGVVLTDYIPTNVTYVSSNPSGTYASGVVTWNLGSLPVGGAVTVTLLGNVASPLPNGTQLVNAASLRSAENPPVGALAASTVTSSPLFIVTKTAASPVVAPNGTMTYTISYRNVGNENSLNTVLTDFLPANAAYFAHTSNGGPGTHDAVANTVTWNLGTVAAGASGSEQVTIFVAAGTPNGTLILNSATLTGDDALSASAQAPLVVGAFPALRHVQNPAATVASPGQQVTFTLEYQNVGSGLATGAVVIDSVPASLNFVSASGGGVWNAGARTVTWNLANLPAGSGGSVTLTLAVDTLTPPLDGALLTNTSSFDTNETQPVTAAAQLSISAPYFLISKTGAPDPVSAGGQIAWVIQFQNVGTGTATAGSISDTLAPELSFLSATGGGSYDAGTRSVTWSLPALAPGASGSVTVLTRVANPLSNGTLLRNDAFIDSLQTSPAAAAALATVLAAPALSLTKAGSPNPVSPGGVVTYTLTVVNNGNDAATSVVVLDRLPTGLTFLSASAGGFYDPNQNVVTWNVGNVPAGSGPIFLTLQVRVQAFPGIVTNTAEISSAESPTLVVSDDLRVEEFAQVPALAGPGLAALALALGLLGAWVLRK